MGHDDIEVRLMVENAAVAGRVMLAELVQDSYFPAELVAKGQQILLRFAEQIEATQPEDLAALYTLSSEATREFNALDEELQQSCCEIETVARDSIATDFDFIANAYGFTDADLEELVADREW